MLLLQRPNTCITLVKQRYCYTSMAACYSTASRGGCTQGCTNSIGSYSCYCGNGYSLNADLLACDNVNECAADNTHSCYSTALCTDTVGGYDCACPEGFRLKVKGLRLWLYIVTMLAAVFCELSSSGWDTCNLVIKEQTFDCS